MIAPLTPLAIRGAIWYQGENNASRSQGYLYRDLFPAMIEDWRRAWGQGPFPFLFVQLANYRRVPEKHEWPELREAQTMTLGLRNTGMAVTIDIGDSEDIHPANKQDVGHRLALAARSVAYGREVVHSGPSYRQLTREGSNVRLWFDSLGGGLKAAGRRQPERLRHCRSGPRIPRSRSLHRRRHGRRMEPQGENAGCGALRLARRSPSDALQPQRPARFAVPNRRLAGRGDAGVKGVRRSSSVRRRRFTPPRPIHTMGEAASAAILPPAINASFPARRDGRAVEGARLESVCRGNSTEGSNPSLSATWFYK